MGMAVRARSMRVTVGATTAAVAVCMPQGEDTHQVDEETADGDSLVKK